MEERKKLPSQIFKVEILRENGQIIWRCKPHMPAEMDKEAEEFFKEVENVVEALRKAEKEYQEELSKEEP
jgi:hypothetical protein